MRINHSILGYLGVPIFRQTQIAIFMGKTTWDPVAFFSG
jgi:hypothetical protein